ncbi:MAG: cysteine desulfurase [Clostridia bacterium]|nr:cysteine desulfurase [Clostridia bacterium]
MRRIYLDNSATTKISEAALKRYVDSSVEYFANPSSLHSLGADAEREIKAVRGRVLSSLGMREGGVIFTASGSEANNLAIFGRAYAKERYKKGAKIITTEGEHASVTEPLERLKSEGFKIAYIPTVGGVIDLERLREELTGDTVLVTMMLVNNETGALYDIAAVARLVHSLSPEALVHVDATQGYMKLPINARTLGADMITLSSHKIHGPKGVGALYVGSDVLKSRGLSPIIHGGGQEMGLRSGTENVPAILAFGTAVEEGVRELAESSKKMNEMRDYLIEKLTRVEALAEISPTLPPSHAPHILNVTLPSIKSETMLHYLSGEGIFVSSGSACSSNAPHVSRALVAYGRSEREADCSIRISLSRETTGEEIDALCDALASGLKRLARIR